MNSSPVIERTIFEKIIASNQIALPSVIFTFGAGHPFDLLKTKMQANPNIYSGYLLSKDIYNTSGIRGFYTGGVPNLTRHIFKNLYRTPQRAFINSYLNSTL